MTHPLMKIVVGLSMGAAVLLSGCGPSTCDRAEQAGEALQEKKGSCNATVTTAPRATCDANISNCSADDQEKLVAMFDCMENVPACEAGKEFDWLGSIAACSSHTEGVSETCRRAIQTE